MSYSTICNYHNLRGLALDALARGHSVLAHIRPENGHEDRLGWLMPVVEVDADATEIKTGQTLTVCKLIGGMPANGISPCFDCPECDRNAAGWSHPKLHHYYRDDFKQSVTRLLATGGESVVAELLTWAQAKLEASHPEDPA